LSPDAVAPPALTEARRVQHVDLRVGRREHVALQGISEHNATKAWQEALAGMPGGNTAAASWKLWRAALQNDGARRPHPAPPPGGQLTQRQPNPTP
jgi:hypothetical protein